MLAEWMVGVCAILLGCLFSATGMVLMKASAQLEKGMPFYLRKRWFFGFLFLVVNASVLDTVALALAPLSLLAPFAGCTIVFSALLARCGAISAVEAVHGSRWLAIVVILSGVTVVSLFGPHEAVQVTEDNVYDFFFNPGFEVFAGLSSVAIGVVVVLWWARPEDMGSKALAPLLAYAAASCGALSLNFLKVIALGIRATLDESAPNQLLQPHTFLSLVALATFAPLQLALLNSVLTQSPVTYAVPLYESLLIVVTIVAGGTFYGEFEQLDARGCYGFLSGVLVTVFGLVLLALSHSHHDDQHAHPHGHGHSHKHAHHAHAGGEALALEAGGDVGSGDGVADTGLAYEKAMQAGALDGYVALDGPTSPGAAKAVSGHRLAMAGVVASDGSPAIESDGSRGGKLRRWLLGRGPA